MRSLLVFTAFLAGIGVLVALTWLRLSPSRRVRSEVAAGPSADGPAPRGDDEARLEALERRLDELAFGLNALRDELRRLESPSRAPAQDASPVAPAEGRGSAEERGPSWYLDQYVASFAQGGEGSEYFRLAVHAFAPSLVREIGAIALDARGHATLRLRLVEMLGDARFRGHDAVIELLLRLLHARGAAGLVDAALDALQRVGDARTAQALERVLWSIEPAASRWKAVQALVVLSGDAANSVLVRLWTSADEADRLQLVGLVLPNEGEHSLALFELASYAGQNVRRKAAEAVGQFRFPGFAPFVAAWRARETDDEVRAALGEAETALRAPPRWSPERAIGPPDAESLSDDPNAWATLQPDMGMQWIDLGYDPPLAASVVRIFEVCVPGAISAVSALDERGNRHELWSGVDPTPTPGVFELTIPLTSFRVQRLRLTLDTDRRPGWSEIDAVELVGPEGRAWASSASASSSYGR